MGWVKNRPFVADPVDVARVASGPAEPLDIRQLFERNYSSIWRLLRRLGVPTAQLDDATQEVFWVAARRLLDIDPGREHAFLYGVALRVASNHLRRQSAALPVAELELAKNIADTGSTPEQQLERSQVRALLDAVLLQLPLELRTVWVLVELEGLEVREVAQLEEIPVGTASSRLRRAREAFSEIAQRVHARLQHGASRSCQ